MKHEDPHLTDEQLLLAADGELSRQREERVRAHLSACWECRARMAELEGAVSAFIREHRRELDPRLPPATGPRALLKARLANLTDQPAPEPIPKWRQVALAAAACLLAVLGILELSRNGGEERLSIPRSSLTPGSVRQVTAAEVCTARLGSNAAVVPAVQRQVFEEYGMAGAEPAKYEVDYLITPALGGSDEIRNLWPQPYSGSVWNAFVKDALEDHLRQLVCTGRLDLATAQREIAVNWIIAYKKYFHTDRPIDVHTRPH